MESENVRGENGDSRLTRPSEAMNKADEKRRSRCLEFTVTPEMERDAQRAIKSARRVGKKTKG
jgi:hypothetical protein